MRVPVVAEARIVLFLLSWPVLCQVRDLTLEQRRVALIIGNESYSGASVRTAQNDAKLIAQKAKNAGFEVREHLNTRLPELDKAIDQTIASIRKGDAVVVYYSGLCLGIGTENFLVPVDFTPKDSADAKYTTYSVSRLLDRLESAGAGVVVLFLDASRKNPFGLRDPVKELPVAMGAGGASHIIFPAAPGTTSVDLAESRNSLFAGFLADALGVAGSSIGDLFTRVQEKVFWASGGRQAPVISSGADTRTQIVPASMEAAPALFELEFKAWQKASGSSESEIRSFLSSYPDGAFQEAFASMLRASGSANLTGTPGPAANFITASKSPSGKIEKMARLTKPEVDPNFSFVAADTELLVQVEAFEKRLERDGMVEEDAELEAYVSQVGQSILPSLEPPPQIRWRFRVLRDPSLNAFALPNGSIYVNSGMLAVLDNESQLAGVLAHEITHVTGRHGYYANRDYRKKSTAISIVQMIANYAPTGTDTTSGSIRSASQLAAVLVPAILNASITGYARELERNADLYAIEKLRDTGYDPREMVNAFRHLQEQHEVELRTFYYNDHPKLEDRIAYLGVALGLGGGAASPMYAVQQKRFRELTRRVSLANVRWTILAGLRRTALARARKLGELEPNSADTLLAQADAFRALGPWTPEIQPVELTEDARKKLLKAKMKLTAQEIEAEAMKTPAGHSAWMQNAKAAEDLYQKALALDPAKAEIHMNLGQLFEKSGDLPRAAASYRSFLAAMPTHPDAVRVQRKLETMGGSLPTRK